MQPVQAPAQSFSREHEEEIRAYLRALLDKREFVASARNRRFLAYVVEETLQGRADRIKAYNVALAAFDRTGDFDPLTDPIVRIEAGRLRRSLEHYYLTAGKSDRIRIDMPKGAYAMTFAYANPAPTEPEPREAAIRRESHHPKPIHVAAKSGRGWGRLALATLALAVVVSGMAAYGVRLYRGLPTAAEVPVLVVLPFEDTSGDPSRSFVARGLTYDLLAALIKLDDVAVFGPRPGSEYAASASEFKSDYVVVGSVRSDRYKVRVLVFLVDAKVGKLLRSWSFEGDLATRGVLDVQTEIASQVLASIRTGCALATVERSGSSGVPDVCRNPRLIAVR